MDETLVQIPEELLLDCYIFITDALERALPPIPAGEAARLHAQLDALVTSLI